jgi:hypothetical protein
LSEYLKEIRTWTSEQRFERIGVVGKELRKFLDVCSNYRSEFVIDGILDEAVILWLEEFRFVFPNHSPREVFRLFLEGIDEEGRFDEIPTMKLVADRFYETDKVIDLYQKASTNQKERFREILIDRGII